MLHNCIAHDNDSDSHFGSQKGVLSRTLQNDTTVKSPYLCFVVGLMSDTQASSSSVLSSELLEDSQPQSQSIASICSIVPSPQGSPQADIIGAMDRMFRPLPPGATIYDRLGPLQGILMYDAICKQFQVGPDFTLHFVDPKTGLLWLADHDLNKREEGGTIEEYTESIKDHGLAATSRGVPLTQLSDGNKPPHRMLTFRLLSKAMIVAKQRYGGKNALVDFSWKRGLPGAKQFRCDMPDDCSEWLIDWDNQWNGGSKKSFVEVLIIVPKLDVSWTAFAQSAGIRADDSKGGQRYENKRWAWLQENMQVCQQGYLKSSNVFIRMVTMMLS